MRFYILLLVLCFSLLSVQAQYGQHGQHGQQISSLSIYPSHAIIKAGNNLQFIAVAVDQNQTHFNPSHVRWYATGGSISQNGLYTANQQDGYHTITVMYGRVQATANVQIKGAYPQISRIEVMPSQVRLTPGQVANFQATAYDSFNRPCSAAFIWNCEGGAIDQSGVYRAGYQAGTFRVWARDRNTGIQGEARVHVQSFTPPEPPQPPIHPWPGQASIIITDFDAGGGNFFTPKVKITLEVKGRNIQSVRLYAVSDNGRISEVDAKSCKHGDKVYFNARYDRFSTRYFEIRLLDNMNQIVAKETRNAK